MTATAAKNERINLRLKLQAKKLIGRAATYEGKTVSSFILSSALASAEKTIHEYDSIQLSEQDVQRFLVALGKPDRFNKKLHKHPIPAALIGRLAVDISAQGMGIGKILQSNAIKRTLAVSDDIAICALVVDAINEKAESFIYVMALPILRPRIIGCSYH